MDAENQIKVSIVVPLYNRKETIGRCLESLMNQTLKEIEIIVVDDGSADHGAEVVREYQKRDGRIHLLLQENQGPGAARNAGIRASHGTYVGFVDCDDFVEISMYEKMFLAVTEKKAEVAVCQEKNICFDENGNVRVLSATKFPCETVKKYSNQKVLDWFLNFTYLCLNSACFKLVKRSVFLEKGIWFPEKHRNVEDLPTSAGIFSAVSAVAFVPENLYCYVHETGTRSTSCSVKKATDIYQNMLEVLQYLKKAHYQGSTNNFVLGMSFSSLRQFYGTGEAKDRRTKEAYVFLKKWQKARKGIRPVFAGKEIPFLHKIKILAAWLRLESFVCCVVRCLGKIPFFKYMV